MTVEPQPERLAALVQALGGPDETLLAKAVGLFPQWDWERAALIGQEDDETRRALEAIAEGRREWVDKWQNAHDSSQPDAEVPPTT
ncbi:MAG: hypothetical protein AB7T37_18390 [Dehalococcoidia bacterium]